MSSNLSPVARGLLLIVLAIGTLGFGAVGLCGGIFTFWLVTDLSAAGMLILSLPCLLGGFFMVWICVRKIGRLLGLPQREKDAS
jgi:hypothetical protein